MTPAAHLIDLSDRAKFRLTGPDSERYLNGQVSHRVSLATPENAIEACVCNVKGKLDGVVHITRSADGEALLIDAPAELRESLLARLDRYLVADDCEWEDVTESLALIHALGPRPDLPGAVWKTSRRFGPVGADLWITPDTRGRMQDRLIPADHPDIETLRIRHGVPRWGAELSADTLPAEAGLDRWAVDFHKGCYLGQEVISRIQSVGRVNRVLSLLEVTDGDAPVGAGLYPVDSDQAKPVGTITSLTADGRLALAYLRREWAGPETKLVTRPTDAKMKVGNLEVRIFD